MAKTPDPTIWFVDLLKTQESVLWPGGDPSELARTLTQTMQPFTKAAADLATLQLSMFQQLAAPWLAMMPAMPSAEPITDRRFSGEAWKNDPRYEALARTYLAQTDAIFKLLDAAPMDDRTKAQWEFALRQITDAVSPANTLATNPEALQTAMETGGASLLEGARLFTEDFAAGRVSMTDSTAFTVGENVCTTPGAVVFQNELIQLIQYTPTTEQVYRTPLLIVPPCINKYYILDLQPTNSFVAHAVAEGNTVFLVSWRNAGPEQGSLGWDDYISDGVLTAIEVACSIAKSKQVNTLGFCIGGALLSSALAVAAARGEHPAASLTLLTTMLDYSDTGELGLLISEDAVKQREATIGKGGLLQGSELAQVFAALRANDLIWPYVVNGYLKGQAPPAFDLLYWNSDDTNLPGPMFCWYLRNTYLKNQLREPGGTTQCGEQVDLASIDVPTFVYASKEDHIVPWKTAFNSLEILSGDLTFVLGASGHIAGVINPPAKKKRNYWTGGTGTDPDQWFESAESVPGSWWPAWYEWLAQFSGEKVAAPKKPGNATYKKLEDAPGSYVKAPAPSA